MICCFGGQLRCGRTTHDRREPVAQEAAFGAKLARRQRTSVAEAAINYVAGAGSSPFGAAGDAHTKLPNLGRAASQSSERPICMLDASARFIHPIERPIVKLAYRRRRRLLGQRSPDGALGRLGARAPAGMRASMRPSAARLAAPTFVDPIQ